MDSNSGLVARANDATDATDSKVVYRLTTSRRGINHGQQDLVDALGALDGLFNELIHVTTDDGEAASQLNKRDAVGDLLQNMIDLISSVSTEDYFVIQFLT